MMVKYKSKNTQRGITLIALVVTIIVLLILAGVAISMLSGENGILRQAANAKTESERQSLIEQIKLGAMSALTKGFGIIESADDLKTALTQQGLKDTTVTGDKTTGYIVTVGDTVYKVSSNGNVSVSEPSELDKLKEIKAGEYASEKSKYIDSNNKVAIIPQGFTVSDITGETTIKTGLVIYRGDLSGVENMKEYQSTNDQFVWIPVDNPTDMYGKISDSEYYGRLYEFNSDGTTTHLNWYEEIEVTDEEFEQAQAEYNEVYTQLTEEINGLTEEEKNNILQTYGTLDVETLMEIIYGATRIESKEEIRYSKYCKGYREPDILTSSDAYTSEDKGLNLLSTIVGIQGTVGVDDETMLDTWKTQIQTAFKEMISSVVINKGFYVGRFETSLNSSGNAQTVKGIKSATATSGSANTWYGLYQKEREYSSKNSLTEVVGSSMIWGSQYDQMMLWMKENKIDVTLTTPTTTEGTTSKNTSQNTGSVETDKLNNVYDLLGCDYEWTLEAQGSLLRTLRGGGCWNTYSASKRQLWYPNMTYKTANPSSESPLSSRLTLYVK